MVNDRDELVAILDNLAHNTKKSEAQQRLSDFFESKGVEADQVSAWSARGGTQQIRNRVGQDGPQTSPEVVIFFLKDKDNVKAVEEWLSECFRGETTTPIPVGPVALAQPSSASEVDGATVYSDHSIVSIIGDRKTAASRILSEAFGVDQLNPLGSGPIQKPDGAQSLLIRVEAADEVDAPLITSGPVSAAQDDLVVIVVEPDDMVVAVGQVGSVSSDGRVTLRRVLKAREPFPLSEVE